MSCILSPTLTLGFKFNSAVTVTLLTSIEPFLPIVTAESPAPILLTDMLMVRAPLILPPRVTVLLIPWAVFVASL